MNEQLRKIETMLSALCQHNDMIQWIDRFAVGSNDGGAYVSLFNSRAKYRLCNVYSEDFKKLPEFIQSRIVDLTTDHEIGSEKNRAEKKGLLHKCELFAIVRYQRGSAEDDKRQWKLGGILFQPRQNGHGSQNGSNGSQRPPQQSQAPDVLPGSLDDLPETPWDDPDVGALAERNKLKAKIAEVFPKDTEDATRWLLSFYTGMVNARPVSGLFKLDEAQAAQLRYWLEERTAKIVKMFERHAEEEFAPASQHPEAVL